MHGWYTSYWNGNLVFLIFGGHKSFCTYVPFVGPLIPLFWTSGDDCPGFQSQGEFLHLCSLSPVCNGFPRFTCGVTPVDILTASMAVKPFHSCFCMQALYSSPGSSIMLPHSNVMRHMLYRLSNSGSAILWNLRTNIEPSQLVNRLSSNSHLVTLIKNCVASKLDKNVLLAVWQWMTPSGADHHGKSHVTFFECE